MRKYPITIQDETTLCKMKPHYVFYHSGEPGSHFKWTVNNILVRAHHNMCMRNEVIKCAWSTNFSARGYLFILEPPLLPTGVLHLNFHLPSPLRVES